MSSDLLSPTDTEDRLAGGAFTHLDGTLHATFGTPDFASATELVEKVAQAAERMNHHPDVSLGYGKVAFQLSSHDAGGVTERDLALAAEIQALADGLGAHAQAVTPTRYELAIDCSNADDIRDFWRVGLDYEEHAVADGVQLVDPRGRGPKVWFQHMEPPRTGSHPRRRLRSPGRRRGPRGCDRGGRRRPNDGRARAQLVGAGGRRGQRTVRLHIRAMIAELIGARS
jgi:4a-hydroxytetrahydrobiopterin dehydratase